MIKEDKLLNSFISPYINLISELIKLSDEDMKEAIVMSIYQIEDIPNDEKEKNIEELYKLSLEHKKEKAHKDEENMLRFVTETKDLNLNVIVNILEETIEEDESIPFAKKDEIFNLEFKKYMDKKTELFST